MSDLNGLDLKISSDYRGRIAPSPTGFLHLGHARTFWTAQERARKNSGVLVLRNEDLDSARCKPEFVAAMIEDLRWFDFEWDEGPDCGGAFGPYSQSARLPMYSAALEQLHRGNFIYPCRCSRKDLQSAVAAPHAADDELIYPGTCQPAKPPGEAERIFTDKNPGSHVPTPLITPRSKTNWRFQVPDGEVISFVDGHFGPQRFVAGRDFGDFVVWRHDGIPAYQLAVVVDDAAMQITEVVRGADLLLSTARQILLYRALGLPVPAFYHCPLMMNENNQRLAKRHDSLSLRNLRANGVTPEKLRKEWTL